MPVRILKVTRMLGQARRKAGEFVDPPPKPTIRLAGLWLEQAGFLANQQVQVEVAPGRLVITRCNESQPPED